MSNKQNSGLAFLVGRGRNKPGAVVEDDAQIAKLVGSLRKAGRVKTRGDLPMYRKVMTATYDVTGNDLSEVAALDMGDREAMLLVSEGALGQPLHKNLRRRLGEAGYTLTQERLADVALIADINKAINREGADNKASDVKLIVEELIRDAITQQATDIHLCCREKSAMVLFRVHSRLYPYNGYDVDTCDQMAGYLFTHMADPSSRSTGTFSEALKSMSCMIRHTVNGSQYKLRYKFIRLADGWDVVIRILAVEIAGSASKTFAELGFEATQIKQLELSVARSIGFITFTGPTGGGKSTSLKASMEFDPNRRFRKRYSLEDPVEYKIFLVSQISIQRSDHEEEEDSAKALIGALRDILRGDPDEIMVGETRDRATASIVADFVLTGHKLYTSLHTSSAFGAVLRLARLGLDRHILADRQFISALVFQRLLPVLCEHCKVPSRNVLGEEKLRLLEHKFGLNPDHIYCSTETD